MADVGGEEEVACVLEWPVLWDLVFALGVVLDECDDLLQRSVVTDQFQRCAGSDFRDRVEIVAAEEDAEVDEL